MEKVQGDLERWQAVMERHAASGKTIAVFCEEGRHSISPFRKIESAIAM